jgi:hypothetical protein
MPTEPNKAFIFVGYAHADAKWLSFVSGYLRLVAKHCAVDIWIDTLMPAGDDWEKEIERKLCACDVFILLVSRDSLSSDYVVDKEIAIIRERQGKGEDVHFYPLLPTPTPKIALRLVWDKSLRPRNGKPLSGYSLNERCRHLSDATDELGAIALDIAARKMPAPRTVSSGPMNEEAERLRHLACPGNEVAAQ